MTTLRLLFAPALAMTISSGCAALLPAPTPMASLQYQRQADQPKRCLLLMLPGRGDRADDYAKHGFIEALQKRPLEVDAVAANAVVGYYARRTLLERLREDVLEPAKAQGYEQVWVVGISMGGLGSLLYAKEHPGFAGVVLLAPFLGDEAVIEEIEKVGGLGKWAPPAEIARDDYQRDLWRWLKGAVEKGQPRLLLGFGEQDFMARSHRLLAAALPEGSTFRTEGKHDWGTWSRLWNRLLDDSELARACAAPAPVAAE
ncbi:MAG: alpha/beta fold hydrolase [Deltaproteobacteria bacterium]|nr:alpha/beta fold hydrolase [Deltaproteobacteria bacterium]